jgi:hypothetical protein
MPNCLLSNCGEDGCGGFCGAPGRRGQCPQGYGCISDGSSTSHVCCKPDCRGRVCGDDGCGGSCGTCGSGLTCNRYRQCVDPNLVPPSPSALPPARPIYTTGTSQYSGAFFGGVVVTAVVGVATVYFLRARRLKSAYYQSLRKARNQ